MEIGGGYYAEKTDEDGEQMPRMPAFPYHASGGSRRLVLMRMIMRLPQRQLSFCSPQTKWGDIPEEDNLGDRTHFSPSMGTAMNKDCRKPKKNTNEPA